MEEQQQTRDEEMPSMHRKEISQLQVKQVAPNQEGAIDSNADCTFQWKVVEDAFLPLLPALKEMYASEITSLGYKISSCLTEEEEWKNYAALWFAIMEEPLTGRAYQYDSIKGRLKIVQVEDADSVKRIKEELNCILKERFFENKRLEKKCETFGLTVREVKLDEHSLYRAIEDQLTVHPGGSSRYGYQELRELAAAHMSDHASDFLPYTNEEVANSDILHSKKFQNYCQDLKALSHCLKRHIMVLSGYYSDIELGKEYKNGGVTIYLSYHRGAFRLGPHYNSLVPRCQKKQISPWQARVIADRQAAAVRRAEEEMVVAGVFERLLPALKEMYPNEIALLGYDFSDLSIDEEGKNRSNLFSAMGGLLYTHGREAVQSEASNIEFNSQKRVQQEEAERVQRVKKDLNCLMRMKYFQSGIIKREAGPLGLTIKGIKNDEHSLYRAVEDQLKLYGGSSPYGYQELRRLTASYMREHVSDLLGCFYPDKQIRQTNIPKSEQFKMYCDKVESAAQLPGLCFPELEALAHCLKRHIRVFSATSFASEYGRQYRSHGRTIFLSHHSSLFRIRTHYNSLVPA